MLKPADLCAGKQSSAAAAFGRLCVETRGHLAHLSRKNAAAFGRLCVETFGGMNAITPPNAAAFGRLCVETWFGIDVPAKFMQPPSGGCVLKPGRRLSVRQVRFGSRLRAAVC